MFADGKPFNGRRDAVRRKVSGHPSMPWDSKAAPARCGARMPRRIATLVFALVPFMVYTPCIHAEVLHDIWRWQEGRRVQDYQVGALGVAVDAEDDLILTGVFIGNGKPVEHDLAVKLSGATGQEIWRCGADAIPLDHSYAVAVDAAGGIFLAGDLSVSLVGGQEGGTEVVTANGTYPRDVGGGGRLLLDKSLGVAAAVKLNGETGNEMWRWQGAAAGPNVSLASIQAAAVDDQGDIFLAGHSLPGSGATGAHFIAMKLDGETGEEKWAWNGFFSSANNTPIDVPAGTWAVTSAAVDASGHLLLAGHVYAPLSNNTVVSSGQGTPATGGGGTGFGIDFAAVRLNGKTGDEIWSWRDGTGGDDRINAVAVGPDGNYLLAGSTDGGWWAGETGETVGTGSGGASRRRWLRR
ncbi:unnamed protein product, partial [Discosporangium mesarthrocarpum]